MQHIGYSVDSTHCTWRNGHLHVKSLLHWTLLLPITLLGCSTVDPRLSEPATPAQVDQYYQVPATPMDAFHYPTSLGELQILGATQYEYRYQGFALRYGIEKAPWVSSDVLVYPVVRPDMLSLTDLLDEHYKTLAQEFSSAAAAGNWESAEVLETNTFSWKRQSTSMEGLHGVFKLSSGANSYLSHIYLTVRDGRFIQARITHPQGSPAKVASIAERLLSAINAKNRPTPTEPEIVVVVPQEAAQTHTEQELAQTMAPWMGYGASQAEAIRAGRYLDTFDRRLAASRAALEAWSDMSRQGVNGDAAIRQLAAAEEAGFLKEYVWSTQAKPYWQAPSDLRLDAFNQWQTEQFGNTLANNPEVIVRWRNPAAAPAD